MTKISKFKTLEFRILNLFRVWCLGFRISAQKRGQAALIAVVFMLAITLSAVFGIVGLAFREIRVSSENNKAKNSYFTAEAGIEDAVYRLMRGKNLSSSYSVTLNNATANIEVTDIAASQKEINAKTIWSQARGLMFRKKQNLIMIFPEERIISLHNFFVFYPLEIIVLDKDKRVVEIRKNFKPFTFWTSSEKGQYLIELGLENSQNKTKVGEQLEIR